MEIISLDQLNLETEHICCALDSKTSNVGVAAKKEWLSARLNDGLRFKKANVRGKVFIEYIPAENAWMPIEADNCMHINCHWVSGSHKGKGYGKALLEECEQEARQLGKSGVTVVVGSKKKPFLSDKSFYEQCGYKVVDSVDPYFELMFKPLDENGCTPRFKDSVRYGQIEGLNGIDIFYTAQCPFTVPYIELLKPVIMASDVPVRTHQIKSKEEAQSHFCPVTTYSIFVNGKFHTQEILTPKKLEQLIAKF